MRHDILAIGCAAGFGGDRTDAAAPSRPRGPDGDLACLEAQSGKIRWQKSLRKEFGGKPGEWAYAEAPLVDGDVVVVTPGAPDRDWSCREFRSGVPAGTRTSFFDLSRWLRFAPPPANFRRPSGTENSSAEFASSIPSNRTPKAPPI